MTVVTSDIAKQYRMLGSNPCWPWETFACGSQSGPQLSASPARKRWQQQLRALRVIETPIRFRISVQARWYSRQLGRLRCDPQQITWGGPCPGPGDRSLLRQQRLCEELLLATTSLHRYAAAGPETSFGIRPPTWRDNPAEDEQENWTWNSGSC